MGINSFVNISEKIIHAYTKKCEPLLGEFGLSQVSFDILMFLTNNPEFVTAQEISDIRHIKKNLVSVHVEKLVHAGLLKRSAVNGDRRKIALTCTEKSKPITNAGLQMQKCFYEELTVGIEKEQWDILTEIQKTIEANAKKMTAK